MSSKRVATIVILAILGVVVAIFVLRFATIQRRTAAKSIEEIQAEEGVPVDVRVARRGTIARYVEFLGNVEGINQVQITSSLPLDVTEIVEHEGAEVDKGDVIVRLARGRRGRAFHQYATAEQALENARKDLERTENLYREGAVSGQTLEQARLAYENAKAQFDQAASVVDLVSPIDGVVTMVTATVGAEALPGEPLATVAAVDRMKVRSYVGYAEVSLLRVGQTAYVQVPRPGGRGKPAAQASPAGQASDAAGGQVSRVSLSADPGTNLYLVETTCDNPNGTLRPGMVTTVKVLVEEETNALSVPRIALIERGDRDYVYTVNAGVARLVEVSLGTESGDDVEVLGGVAEGDSVVVRGQYRLADGARASVVTVEGKE